MSMAFRSYIHYILDKRIEFVIVLDIVVIRHSLHILLLFYKRFSIGSRTKKNKKKKKYAQLQQTNNKLIYARIK